MKTGIIYGLAIWCIMQNLAIAQQFTNIYTQHGPGTEKGIRLTTDKQGNLYQMLAYDAKAVVGNVNDGDTLKSELYNDHDFAMVKYNKQGTMLWHMYAKVIASLNWSKEFLIGQSANEFKKNATFYKRNMVVDDSCHVYVTLSVWANKGDSIYFINDNANKIGIKLQDNTTDYIAKIDSTGFIKWVKPISFSLNTSSNIGGGSQYGNEATITPNHKLFLTHRLDSGENPHAGYKAKKQLKQFDLNGNEIAFTDSFAKFWRAADLNQSAHPQMTYAGLQSDNTGNLYFFTPVKRIGTDSIPFIQRKLGLYDDDLYTALVKVNQQGQTLWAGGLTNTLRNNSTPFVVDNKTGNIYITYPVTSFGVFYIWPDASDATFIPMAGTEADFLLVCLDSNGNERWMKQIGGTGADGVNALSVNKDGILYLAGTTTSASLNLGNSLVKHTTGNNTLYLATFDANGNNISAAQASGDFYISAFCNQNNISFTPDGYSYLTGWFGDSINFNCQTIKAQGESDAFIIQFKQQYFFDTTYLTACKSLNSPSGKYNWQASGFYYDTIQSTRGCDSVLFINLQLQQNASTIDTAVCATFQSPSTKYLWATSGTYLDTLTNKSGCDSIITISLKVLQSQSTIDTTVKSFYIPPSGNVKWVNSNTYFDTIPNQYSCDSVITIHLKVLQTTSNLDTNVCNQLTSPSGKYIYKTSGIYNDTIPNTNGGDSLITIKVNLLNSSSIIDTAVCAYFINPSKKDTIKVNGTYTDTLVNSFGCDSVITINLKIADINLTVTSSNKVTCDTPFTTLEASGASSYSWSPNVFLQNNLSALTTAFPPQSTTYYVLGSNQFGCNAKDSVLVEVDKSETIGTLPNVFTPNEDGVNDCFDLTALTKIKEVEFFVYNRWGSLVFETSNVNACWNGKDNSGNTLNAGVYYFVLKGYSSCDTPFVKNGNIQLIK